MSKNTTDTKKRKILVVDDNPDILEAIQFTLETNGYQVQTCEKGEYVENLHKNKELPDLIILDVLMSGKDGKDICKKLKSHPKTKQIPVVMISAHPSAKGSIRKVGANDFLAKPFDVKGLLEIVGKHLKKSTSI